MCPYEFDVAVCGSKVKNGAPSLSLAGHAWVISLI